MPGSYTPGIEYLLELDAQIIARRISLAERLAILEIDVMFARSQHAGITNTLSRYSSRLIEHLRANDIDPSSNNTMTGTRGEASGVVKELVKAIAKKNKEEAKALVTVEEIVSEIAEVKIKIELLDDIYRTTCANCSWTEEDEEDEEEEEGKVEEEEEDAADSGCFEADTLASDTEVGEEVTDWNSVTSGEISTHSPDSLRYPWSLKVKSE